MGLYVTHDCFSRSYGTFNRWRDRLAELAGLRFRGAGRGRYPELLHYYVEQANFESLLKGDWDKMPEEPLALLIVHHDCDGYIKWEHCTALADRLEELLPKFACPDEADEYDITCRFIKGLRAAAEVKENVEFE